MKPLWLGLDGARRAAARLRRAAGPAAALLLLILCGALASPGAARADVFGREDVGRNALVIANANYGDASAPSASADAAAMADMLRRHGFNVTVAEDLSGREMLSMMRDFASAADEGVLNVFYYSGLALQVARENFLLPIDARPTSPLDASRMGVPLETVFEPATLVLLDASHRNSIEEDFRGFSAGLALMEPPPSVAVAMSTGPGRITADPDRGPSLFTSALIGAIGSSSALEDALEKASEEVRGLTSGQQVPWASGSVSAVLDALTPDPTLLGRPATGLTPVPRPAPDRVAAAPPPAPEPEPEPEPQETVLAERTAPATAAPEAPAAPAAAPGAPPAAEQPAATGGVATPDAFELAFWETIRDSNNPADFQAYIDTYPNGRFIPLARLRVGQARQQAAAQQAAAQQAAAQQAAEQQAAATRQAPAQEVARAPEAAAPVPQTPPPAASPAEEAEPTGTLVLSPVPEPRQPAAAEASAPQGPGSQFRDCADCPQMTVVPAGTYTMGSDAGSRFARPAHSVSIGAPFAIGVTEVTISQWDACLEAGACEYQPQTRGWGGGDLPVFNVSWQDAQDYVRYLSSRTGLNYRLPTEAEWEYAARAGTGSRFWWGEEIAAGRPNCRDCGSGPAQAVAVGAGPANPFGLHDTSGNVAEWVVDCWYADHAGAPGDGSARTEPRCRERVLRGGSFASGQDAVSSDARYKYDADVRYYANGFRVARDL